MGVRRPLARLVRSPLPAEPVMHLVEWRLARATQKTEVAPLIFWLVRRVTVLAAI